MCECVVTMIRANLRLKVMLSSIFSKLKRKNFGEKQNETKNKNKFLNENITQQRQKKKV